MPVAGPSPQTELPTELPTKLLTELPTIPGQPDVPQFAAKWSGALVFVSGNLPERKETDRKLKSFHVAPGYIDSRSGARSKGFSSNVKSPEELKAEADMLAQACPASTVDQQKQYKSTFDGLGESTVLSIVQEDNGPDLNKCLEFKFERQESDSKLNNQFKHPSRGATISSTAWSRSNSEASS